MPEKNEPCRPQDAPKCETCGNYAPHPARPHSGTCWQDGSIRDEKETCWFHTKKLEELKEGRDGKHLSNL